MLRKNTNKAPWKMSFSIKTKTYLELTISFPAKKPVFHSGPWNWVNSWPHSSPEPQNDDEAPDWWCELWTKLPPWQYLRLSGTFFTFGKHSSTLHRLLLSRTQANLKALLKAYFLSYDGHSPLCLGNKSVLFIIQDKPQWLRMVNKAQATEFSSTEWDKIKIFLRTQNCKIQRF